MFQWEWNAWCLVLCGPTVRTAPPLLSFSLLPYAPLYSFPHIPYTSSKCLVSTVFSPKIGVSPRLVFVSVSLSLSLCVSEGVGRREGDQPCNNGEESWALNLALPCENISIIFSLCFSFCWPSFHLFRSQTTEPRENCHTPKQPRSSPLLWLLPCWEDRWTALSVLCCKGLAESSSEPIREIAAVVLLASEGLHCRFQDSKTSP